MWRCNPAAIGDWVFQAKETDDGRTGEPHTASTGPLCSRAAGLYLHILKVVPYTQMALIRGLPDHTSLNWFHPLLYQFFSSMELFTIWPVLLICLSQWRQEAFPTISFISPFLFISSNHFIPPASRSAYLMVIRKKYLLNKLVNTFLIIGISYFQIVYSNGINKLSGWICCEMLLDL